MIKRIWLLGGVMAGLFHAAVSHAGAVYYVQSANAKILSGPSFKSGVIAGAAQGETLVSTGTEGSWVKVIVGGKEGYVSTLLLSTHPPIKKVEIVKAEEPEINEGVRRRASSFSSAAAARGLTKEERQRADVEEGVDMGALKKMESLKFADDEVSRFIAGGQ